MEIITTSITRPPRILIYGEQGAGKSTLGKEMPEPIFIQTSDGLEGLSVKAFPIAEKLQDVRDALQYLLKEKHSFKTLVIDTLGGLERLVFAECCAELGLEFMTQKSVSSYPLAHKKIQALMETLNKLNQTRKMFVLLIGHSEISKFEDPTTSNYDRYALALNEKIARFFLQEVDIVGFVNQKVMVRQENADFSKTNKASGSSRFIFFEKSPAYYAKDHDYGLPAEVRLEKGKSWTAIYEHMKARLAAQAGDLKQIADEQKKRRAEKIEASAQI